MRFREVAVRRTALLVLDPREWFASWHGTGTDLQSEPDARIPAVVRPTATLTVTAEPTGPADPRWPFAGRVELVLARTPTGLLAFFGRVRSPGGPLWRLPLKAATAKLRVEAPGYAPVVIDSVSIPDPDGPPGVVRFDLLPDPSYPFPDGPTTLAGSLVNPDGTGIAGAAVDVPGEAELVPTVTGENGGWVLVLDRKSDRLPVGSPIDLRFAPPGGAAFTVTGVAFEAGRANRLARTTIP